MTFYAFSWHGNTKTGPMPVTMSPASTCPPSCGLRDGCYAKTGPISWHWRKLDASGSTWAGILTAIRQIPNGWLWRHNSAGDLPGVGERLDVAQLAELVQANEDAGARGFTFTHKRPRNARELAAIADANRRGFTVNLSADSMRQADELSALGVAPVVVVVASDAPEKSRTPAGRPVVVCRAQARPGVTCADCGLCAAAGRKAIVAFRAHGGRTNLVNELVRSKRSGTKGKRR